MAKHSPQRIQASYTHCRANKFCNSELVNCSASRYPSSGSPLPCIRLEEWQYLKSSNGVTEKRWLLHLHCLPELTGQQNKFMIDIDRLCCASFGRDGELNVVFLSHAHISFGVYMCVYMCVCVCVCTICNDKQIPVSAVSCILSSKPSKTRRSSHWSQSKTILLFIYGIQKATKIPCALSSTCATFAARSTAGVKPPSTVQSCISCSSTASCAMISCRRHSVRGLG